MSMRAPRFGDVESGSAADALQSDNDRHIDTLAAKVKIIKGITRGLRDDVVESDRLAEQVGSQVLLSTDSLRGTVSRLLSLNKNSSYSCRTMLLAIVGVVVAFVLLYLYFAKLAPAVAPPSSSSSSLSTSPAASSSSTNAAS